MSEIRIGSVHISTDHFINSERVASAKTFEDISPIDQSLLADFTAEAGLPPGVFNVIQGIGEEAGAALVAHPGVDRISFTGSIETAKKIGAAATACWLAHKTIPLNVHGYGKIVRTSLLNAKKLFWVTLPNSKGRITWPVLSSTCTRWPGL